MNTEMDESLPYRKQRILVVGDVEKFERIFNTPLSELVTVVPLLDQIRADMGLQADDRDLKALITAKPCSLYLYEQFKSLEELKEVLDIKSYLFLNHVIGQRLDDQEFDLSDNTKSYCMYLAGGELYVVNIPADVFRIKNRFSPYTQGVRVKRASVQVRTPDFQVVEKSEGLLCELNAWDLLNRSWQHSPENKDVAYVTGFNTNLFFHASDKVMPHYLDDVEKMKSDTTTRFAVFETFHNENG